MASKSPCDLCGALINKSHFFPGAEGGRKEGEREGDAVPCLACWQLKRGRKEVHWKSPVSSTTVDLDHSTWRSVRHVVKLNLSIERGVKRGEIEILDDPEWPCTNLVRSVRTWMAPPCTHLALFIDIFHSSFDFFFPFSRTQLAAGHDPLSAYLSEQRPVISVGWKDGGGLPLPLCVWRICAPLENLPDDNGLAAPSTSSAETSRDGWRHSQVAELPLRCPLVLQME